MQSFDPNANYIRLDDHPYRLRDAVVRFQDARGLINLNLGSYDDLFSLLAIFGVSADDRGPQIAKLQDYVDADSLTRLNGPLTGTTTVILAGDFATITNGYLVPNNARPPTANMSTACLGAIGYQTNGKDRGVGGPRIVRRSWQSRECN